MDILTLKKEMCSFSIIKKQKSRKEMIKGAENKI